MRTIKHVSFWVIALVFLACGPSRAQKISVIDSEQLQQLLKTEEVQLVDVRTPEEVSYGVIVNAKHIDFYDPQFATKVNEMDKEKPIVVYCAVGGRSAQSAVRLKELGFSEIYDLGEGIRGWKAKGYLLQSSE